MFSKMRECMDVFAHVSLCASVLMIVALTCERHFAICSPHAVSFLFYELRIHISTIFIVHSTKYIFQFCSIEYIFELLNGGGICVTTLFLWLSFQLY